MRLAILFSGQGGQQPEHLARLKAEAAPELADALTKAIPELWQTPGDDPTLLSCNRFAQPFIFAYQMTMWRQLQTALPRPICVAGYSLGEMAACAAAGVFSATEGIALCAERARLMDESFAAPAGLLAILGLSDDKAAEVAQHHGLYLAIRNGPGHIVLGGAKTALAAAEASALSLGASRTVALAVTTPSHTPLLAAASAAFRAALAPWAMPARLNIPVLSAIDGRTAHSRPAALDALARQISTPLDWATCLETIVEMQPDRVLEIGPGNALTRMLAEMAPQLPARSVDDFRSLAGVMAWATQ